MNKLKTDAKLLQADVRSCFYFYKSDEFPSGAVKVTKENALKLQSIGWIVMFHNDNYLNYIGCNYKGIEIGFGGWMHTLSASISTPEVGYDNGWGTTIYFKNQDCVDKFVDSISNFVWLSQNNS